MHLGKDQLSDEKALEVLADRARDLARVSDDSQMSMRHDSLVCFDINEKNHFAVIYDEIVTVIPAKKVVPLPGVTEIIDGVIYYDGGILSVINLSRLLSFKQVEEADCQYIMIIGNNDQQIGLSISNLVGQISYDNQLELQSLSEGGKENQKFIKGIYDSKIAILNTRAILKDSQIQVEQRTSL